MRIVSEAEAFLGNSNEVAVKPGILIFVVDHCHTVVAGGQMFPDDCSLTLSWRDGSGSVAEGFVSYLPASRHANKDD